MEHLPDSLLITICGHDYTYYEDDPGQWNPGKWGWSDAHKLEIHIRGDMAKHTRQSTLLHEVIHQIMLINDLEELTMKSEPVISALGVAWMQFIKNNSIVMDYLAG